VSVRSPHDRHPLVDTAQGFPPDVHSQVVADLDQTVCGAAGSTPTLTIRWVAGETPDADPQFSFHYSDDTGRDFGWHDEPNPRVDGWGQFQERSSPSAASRFEAYSFASTAPTRVVWEPLSELTAALDARE
jgi:hypothetical protein